MKRAPDSDLMAFADGELDEHTVENDLALDPVAQRKVEAIGELGELVRGHLELSADALPQKRFDALWREIDKSIERNVDAPVQPRAPAPAGVLRRIGRWFEHYRGHIITGAVSAGAVAAIRIRLRGRAGSSSRR